MATFKVDALSPKGRLVKTQYFNEPSEDHVMLKLQPLFKNKRIGEVRIYMIPPKGCLNVIFTGQALPPSPSMFKEDWH